MIMNNFHVGQKVVCIKDGTWRDTVGLAIHIDHQPTKGNIYTVAAIIGDPNGDAFLNLSECGNLDLYISDEFRPVRTTDISIFNAMLVNPPKQEVEA